MFVARLPLGPDSEVRTCRKHGEVLFHKYGTGRWRCKRCIGEAVTKRHHKVKRQLVEDAGGCCVLCGYDRCMSSLQFHHVDPSQKSFSMTMGSGKSLAAYRAEAAKCVLVCANCHGEIESGMVESPPAGTISTPSGIRTRDLLLEREAS